MANRGGEECISKSTEASLLVERVDGSSDGESFVYATSDNNAPSVVNVVDSTITDSTNDNTNRSDASELVVDIGTDARRDGGLDESGNEMETESLEDATDDKQASLLGRLPLIEGQSFEETRVSDSVAQCEPPDVVNHTQTDDGSEDPMTIEQSRNNETDALYTPNDTQTNSNELLERSGVEDHTQSISPTSEFQGSSNEHQSVVSMQSQSNSDSSFVVVDNGGGMLVVDAASLEESGLFYGADLSRNRNIIHEDHTPTPPPESADDVLLSENVVSEASLATVTTDGGVPSTRRRESESSNDEHRSVEQSLVESEQSSDGRSSNRTQVPMIDPGFIIELEQRAKMLSHQLDETVSGLQTNLDAMSVCAQKSVVLQRETIVGVQETVDESVKAMYTFLSKFNELYSCLQPVRDLSDQISEINEALKVLERIF